MRARDVVSEDPSAEELERLSAGLERGEQGVEALRRLFEKAEATVAREGWPPFLQRARDLVDARRGPGPTSHRKLVGPALVLAKRGFRASFQPFINEVMQAQVRFNEAILDALAQVHDELAQHLENQALFRARVEERLEKLEREAGSGERRPR
jgi:hypothetical protein